MNEENNNIEKGGKESEQDVAEKVQDAVHTVKDGANLAKNIASGNYLGAAKDALNLAKNKKLRKAIIKKMLIQVLGPIIIVLLAGALLLGIYNAVGQAVEAVIGAIVDFFTIDPADGSIVITDEHIDTIINSISELGVDIDGLKLMGDVDYTNPNIQEANKEALRKYIRKFYEAQAMTQTINTKPSWWEDATTSEPFGTVYIHRTNGEGTAMATVDNQLEYITYEEMQNKQQKGASDIKKYFSIDEEGKLVIPMINKTVTKINGTVVSYQPNETTITLEHINYKNVISQYTTSMNFFLYLAIITQNPEFVSAVTDLVKESEIRLVVIESEYKSVVKETNTYTSNKVTVTSKEVEKEIYDSWDTEKKYPHKYTVNELVEGKPTTNTVTTTIETTTTSEIPKLATVYAKTWFCEQNIIYTKVTEGPTTEGPIVQKAGEDEQKPTIAAEGTYIWKTDQMVSYETTTSSAKYEESTRGEVVDKTGNIGDGKKSFIGLLDEEFKIPNSTRTAAAGGNLVSGAEMFFELLKQDANSQNLEQIMRYILYKYTGEDYGITEFDFSIFDAKEFKTAGTSGGIVIEEFIKEYENSALRKYMNGESADYSSVSEYVNNEKTQYKLYYTSADECLNFSYGVMVGYYDEGELYLNNKNYFEEEEIDLQSLIEQYENGEEVYVDVEIIDRIYKKIIQDKKQSIKAAIEAKGVSMKSHQLDALTSIAYQYGNCGVHFSGSDNVAILYRDYYEKGDVEGFKSRLVVEAAGGGTVKYFSGTYGTRENNTWILFNEGKYLLSDGTELASGGAEVADFALQFVGENHSRFTSYSPTNGVEDIWFGDDWCAMFVSYCYNESGLIPDIIPNPFAGCGIIQTLYNEGNSRVRIVGNRGSFARSAEKVDYTPSPGDLIFFHWGDEAETQVSDHVGMVVDCDGVYVYTVEGNSGGSGWATSKVTQKQYLLNEACIVGYISINDN